MFRQPLTHAIDTDDIAGEPGRSTDAPASNWPENRSVIRPTLLVSPQSLTFARTSPGRPSFLLLTISQEHTQTPVVISTDAPDYFQLASDCQPAYTPSLTLTPSLQGTYVHLRYEASRMGVHTGHLFIETPYESQTIALRGSCWRLVSVPHRSILPVNPPTHKNFRWWAGLLILSIVSGLLYGWYRYPTAFSIHFDKEVSRSLTRINHKQINTLANNKDKRLIKNKSGLSTKEVEKAKQKLKTPRKHRAHQQASKRNQQRSGTTITNEESDLERALNQNSLIYQ